MFQQSVDRAHGSARSDLVLFILLVVAFFLVGSIVFYLEAKTGSRIPRYAFIFGAFAALYLIYRLRLVGFRYTVFYKAPEPVYDPRFDDMMLHEDYPYPVGTLVFERIVSAKGTILLTIDKSELVAVLRPGENSSLLENATDSLDASCTKKENAYSLLYDKGEGLKRLYFAPDNECLSHIAEIMEKAPKEE